MQSEQMDIRIDGIVDGKRISTQELLQQLYAALEQGHRDFVIDASGQHNIAGALWDEQGRPLRFRVKNPGQRLGAMGMPGTSILVDGPAPADIGWLNAGAEITLLGDGGDTTAHCAASGNIYVAGRVGARSGALMKADPRFSPPEFWVLETAGSFSFEFMGGGCAIVCGYGHEHAESVLGPRSCVGMVGGTIYVRGPIAGLSNEVWLLELDEGDREFLQQGLQRFAERIEQPELAQELCDWQRWHKIVARTYEERRQRSLMPIADFRARRWVEGGIFGDLLDDDYQVSRLVESDDWRLRFPRWHNAAQSAPCEYNCPVAIPTQRRVDLLRQGRLREAMELILQFSPFPASVCGQVCPNLCMDDCNRRQVDVPVRIGELGSLSREVDVPAPAIERPESIGVIGAGAAGLAAAWHLRRMGYQVDVYEADSSLGGKLRQVIPTERLNPEILDAELQRIESLGIQVHSGCAVDRGMFAQLRQQHQALVLAVGAQQPVVIPFPGNERLLKGLDFLRAVNRGEAPDIGDEVVVIGAGNAAMDVVIGAYGCGARQVTAIDIQKPAAFDKEIAHAEALGARILWPVQTGAITEAGVELADGSLIPADTVIIAVGDRPDLSMLERHCLDERGMPLLDDYLRLEAMPEVFVPGDARQPALFTHALGDGRKVALNIDRMLRGLELDDFARAPMIPQDRVRDAYYHPMNPQRVGQMPAEQETERCLSCGLCRDCGFCKDICPTQAIERHQHAEGFEYRSENQRCIGCGICAGVCPCGIWSMEDNLLKIVEG